jgi:hypothetical protein
MVVTAARRWRRRGEGGSGDGGGKGRGEAMAAAREGRRGDSVNGGRRKEEKTHSGAVL